MVQFSTWPQTFKTKTSHQQQEEQEQLSTLVGLPLQPTSKRGKGFADFITAAETSCFSSVQSETLRAKKSGLVVEDDLIQPRPGFVRVQMQLKKTRLESRIPTDVPLVQERLHLTNGLGWPAFVP